MIKNDLFKQRQCSNALLDNTYQKKKKYNAKLYVCIFAIQHYTKLQKFKTKIKEEFYLNSLLKVIQISQSQLNIWKTREQLFIKVMIESSCIYIHK